METILYFKLNDTLLNVSDYWGRKKEREKKRKRGGGETSIARNEAIKPPLISPANEKNVSGQLLLLVRRVSVLRYPLTRLVTFYRTKLIIIVVGHTAFSRNTVIIVLCIIMFLIALINVLLMT